MLRVILNSESYVSLLPMIARVSRFEEGIQRLGGKHVEKFATVMDLEGVTMSHRHALHVIKLFSACDSQYYPERMGWLAVVNAPGIFGMLWSIVKGWLDPVTAAKVRSRPAPLSVNCCKV